MNDRVPKFSDYIVFVDESGSPTLSPLDPDYPIFVLVFCVVDKMHYAEKIEPSITKLKFDFFGHDTVVLHAHDIRKPKGEFSFLLNAERREHFMQRIEQVMIDADIKLIVHIINKTKLIDRYVNPYDPYNIALRMCLEQLSIFLRKQNQTDHLTHIIAEARGKKEDRDLELEFRRILDPKHNWGLASKFPLSDTPLELRFVDKKLNSAGLQLADFMGQPLGRNFLNPSQMNRAFSIIKTKIYRNIWRFPL